MKILEVTAGEPHAELVKCEIYGTIVLPKCSNKYYTIAPIIFDEDDSVMYDIPQKYNYYIGKRVRIIARIIPPKTVGERTYNKLIVVSIRRH